MKYSTEKEFLQPIWEHGMEGMSEVLQDFFNLAVKLERENALKAAPYQRTEVRTCYANGFKERHIQTQAGELELQIPQPFLGIKKDSKKAINKALEKIREKYISSKENKE